MERIKIYLAGPIDNCSIQEQTIWRHVVKQVYPHYHYLDPMSYEAEYFRGKKTINEIIELEKNDISDCDVLLVYPSKPSSGTAMEVMWAHTRNEIRKSYRKLISIITVIEKDQYLSPWIKFHSTKVFNDFHDAMRWIEDNHGQQSQTM